MREFLFETIKNLKLLTGLKQYENIIRDVKTEKQKKEAQRQVKIWLDSLMNVCDKFGKIEDKTKQKIITENLIKDADYTGFNARTLHKWFSHYWEMTGKHKHYYERQKMVESHDALSPQESQKYIEQMKENLSKIEENAKNTRKKRDKPAYYTESFKKFQEAYLKSRNDK